MVTSDRDFAKCLIEMKEKMSLDIYPLVFHESLDKGGMSVWGKITVYKLDDIFRKSNIENVKRTALIKSYITPHLIQKGEHDTDYYCQTINIDFNHINLN